MHRRVAYHAVFAHLLAACLKLRLHQTDTHSVRGGDALRHREDVMQRNKGNIHTEKLNGLCQILRRDIADVRAFHVYHAFIRPQAPCQLTVANIHGIHLHCAILQHTVGKAAGGRTDVHAHFAVRGKREALHSLFQLQAAAADIADIVTAHLDNCVLLDHLAGLVHLLLVDKNHTGHDQSFGALPALHKSVLHKILVQPNFHSSFSPFVRAARTACTISAASRPVHCLICGTVAWGRQAVRTAQCKKRPFQPFCCKA